MKILSAVIHEGSGKEVANFARGQIDGSVFLVPEIVLESLRPNHPTDEIIEQDQLYNSAGMSAALFRRSGNAWDTNSGRILAQDSKLYCPPLSTGTVSKR
jgi:hypothetical protein